MKRTIPVAMGNVSRGVLIGVIAGALPMLLGACVSMAPKYQRPADAVPQSWPTGPAYAPSQAPGQSSDKGADAGVAAIAWRSYFKDPRLQQVIAQALTDSRNLRQAL